MVKVREQTPLTGTGALHTDAWLDELVTAGVEFDEHRMRELCRLVAGFGDSRLLAGADMAQLAAGIGMDAVCVRACLIYRLLRDELIDETPPPSGAYGVPEIDLARAVLRMGDTSVLELSNSRLLTSEAKDQVENIRKMLVSMIDDPRAAIIKLTERIVALRRAKNDDDGRQLRIAREALWIFAPLANRLGIWRFKWELEDLALRYLDPASYKLIASSLDGRREERERQVAAIARLVADELEARGIHAELAARAKHIYSIWQKMRNKRISFDDVYDVRAIRILVDDVADCYGALGVVHSLFRHVPNEFDDYIANPKENGYRSIHTAVIGPDGKTLEVQVRTFEMHRESEVGVCAHWDYKDDDVDHVAYHDKMQWIRQVLELEEELGDVAGILQQEIVDQRSYVNTPNGHVLDLTAGATALDFAYRVHTHIGHSAIGCRVDGVTRPLNHVLETGQTVEVLTGDAEAPQRDWLERRLAYTNTSRARSKIHAWFRALPSAELIEIGMRLVRDGVARLAISLPTDLPARTGFDTWDELYETAGRGDLQFEDVVRVLEFDSRQMSLLDTGSTSTTDAQAQIVKVVGEDRDGLLRDLTTVLGELGVSLVSISGSERDGKAELTLTTRVDNLSAFATLIDSMRRVPGVLDVTRTL